MVVPNRLFTLYKFPIGRMAFALGNTARRATTLPEPVEPIAELAGRGATMARETLQLIGLYRSSNTGQALYPPQARPLDQLVDAGVSGTHSYLSSQLTMFGHTARGEAAQQMLDALFPEGLVAIVSQPFTAEHERVAVLLDIAESAKLAEARAQLPDLPAMLDELRARNEQYGEVLHEVSDAPTSNDVQRAREQCQDTLCATVGLIIGHFALHAPERTADRDHLLEPIMVQNEAIGRARRRRIVPADTDPDTGEEIGGDGDSQSDDDQAGDAS
ncbi:MAG: hypothetical protein MJE77_15910 [Proteobacteria bacterium]|nr:hypothetical protein [Pseudomonadota bacterium]